MKRKKVPIISIIFQIVIILIKKKTNFIIFNSKGLENLWSLLFSVRFLVSLMIFFGSAILYMESIDMGIAIVCMVNHTSINDTNFAENKINDDIKDHIVRLFINKIKVYIH
jgi:hypothetical protein